MKNKNVKQWIAILTLSCVLTGYIAYDNLAVFHQSNSTYISSTVTPEEQQKLQEEYVSTALASITPEIKKQVDDYVVSYVTENDISKYFTEETINNLTQEVTNTIVSGDENSEAKAEFEAIIADTISQIDFSQYSATSTTTLSENTKAYITSEIASAVQTQLEQANFTYSLSDEDKASITSDLNTKITDLQNQITSILQTVNASTASSDTTYTLSDDEMARINEYVKNNLDISGEVAKYLSDNTTGTSVDIETLKNDIATTVTATLSDQINSIVKDADSHTPVKGVDYFTEDEINTMIDEIASKVQSGTDGKDGVDGYTPVKGVDYFTEDEINSIVSDVLAQVKNGEDGYTPVKGVDYWTEADVNELVAKVQSQVVNGTDGKDGVNGSDGLSAYEIAVEEGFTGSRADWLNSLHGTNGYTPVKGQDYFTDEEISDLTNTITTTIKSSYDNIVTDLQNQIDDIDVAVEANNTAIDTLNDKLTSLSSELSELDSSNTEKISDISTQINDITAQIESLKTSSEALDTSKLDISTFTSYKNDTDNTIASLSTGLSDVNSNLASYKETVANHFDTIDAQLETLASTDEVSAFKTAYEEFKSQVNETLNNLDTTCQTLGNTKLNITDFESYQSAETEKINNIIDNLEENSLLLGTTDFATENYDTLTGAVASIQSEVDSFKEDYGNTTDKINDDISTINGIIGTKTGIFESYNGTLWQLADNLQAQITANNNNSTNSFANISAELTQFKTDTNNSLGTISSDLQSLHEELATKLDSSTFTQYQTTIDQTIASLQSNIDAVNSTLQAEIDTANEAISKESAARIAANTSLQESLDEINGKINEEITARTDADTELQSNIDTVTALIKAETTDRTNADNDLQNNIDAVNSDLSTEITNRTDADKTLQDNIDALKTSWDAFKGTSELTLADIEDFMTQTNESIAGLNDDIADINQSLKWTDISLPTPTLSTSSTTVTATWFNRIYTVDLSQYTELSITIFIHDYCGYETKIVTISKEHKNYDSYMLYAKETNDYEFIGRLAISEYGNAIQISTSKGSTNATKNYFEITGLRAR